MRFARLLAGFALTALVGGAAQAADAPAPLPAQATATQAREDPGLNLDRARSAFRQAPESVWLGLILLELQMQRGLLDEAQALAADLVKRFPNERQVWAQRGYLMFMLQDYKQAQADFTEALLFQNGHPSKCEICNLPLQIAGLQPTRRKQRWRPWRPSASCSRPTFNCVWPKRFWQLAIAQARQLRQPLQKNQR